MSEALQLVLDGEVDVESFILWFSQKSSKETVPLPLLKHSHTRDTFATYFLGYIREQASEALGISNSGLTPRKSSLKTDNTDSTNHHSTTTQVQAVSRVEPSSRARLDFHPIGYSGTPTISHYVNPQRFTSDSNLSNDFRSTPPTGEVHRQSIPRNSSPLGRGQTDGITNRGTPDTTEQKQTISPRFTSDSNYSIDLRRTPSTGGVQENFSRSSSPFESSRTTTTNRGASDASKHRQTMSLAEFIGGGVPIKSTNQRNHKNRQLAQKKSDTNWSNSSNSAERTTSFDAINLNDTTAFPVMALSVVSSRKSQSGRRITPTLVVDRATNLPGSSHFLSTANNQKPQFSSVSDCQPLQQASSGHFTGSDVPDELKPRSLQHERALLQQERAKCAPPLIIMTPDNKTVNFPSLKTQTCFVSSHLPESAVSIPEIISSDVTSEQQLVCLARIYSACLDENLLQCLSVELHFIIQLLTVRATNPDSNEDDSLYLGSGANCVYFSVHVLWLQRRLISFLDAATLKVLRDNSRVTEFLPKLHNFLSQACVGAKSPAASNLWETTNQAVNIVAFQTETDNRNNFVSQYRFSIFRKKRDIFYEILRDWQDNHLMRGWSVAANLEQRIRHLVATDCDAFLYSHLARLFQAQLVVTCQQKYCTLSNDQAENDPELLETLKESNPEKYKRLQERLVTPHQTSGPCPPPNFPGQQEFFKCFIDYAASYSFNHHLINVLHSKLIELTDCQFDLHESCNNKELEEPDGTTRDQFRSCLLTARLLAKFLGYVVFAPYRTAEAVSDCVLANEVTVRNSSVPPVDVLSILRTALRSRRSVLVIPWLVEFLSMMDAVAPYLLYYGTVMNILGGLYEGLTTTGCSSVYTHNHLMLRLLLGWLFEVISYPVVQDKNLDEMSVNRSRDEDRIGATATLQSLDSMAVVDLDTLYACCPYLSVLQTVLAQFANGLNVGGNSVRRKITPVSTVIRAPANTERTLHMQMEQAFFHNQPDSLKKTVDFTIDRLSSKLVKHVRRHLVAGAKQRGSERVVELRKGLALIDGESDPDAFLKAKISAYKQVSQVSLEVADNIKLETREYCKRVCSEEASKILSLLLPEETSTGVLNVCIKLVVRSSSAKVCQSLSTQVDADNFRKDLVHEMQKLLKVSPNEKAVEECVEINCDDSFEIAAVHNNDIPSPAVVLASLKDLLKDLYEVDNLLVNRDDVLQSIVSINNCLQNRKDMNSQTARMMIRLTSEIIVAIAIKRPELCDESSISNFMTLWQDHPAQSQDVLPTIYSIRSFTYMGVAANNLQLSWTKMELITSLFLKKRVSPASAVDLLLIKLLKHSWTETFRLGLVDCLRNVLISYDSIKFDGNYESLVLVSHCLFDDCQRTKSEFTDAT